MHKQLFEHFISAPESHIDPSLREKIVKMQDLEPIEASKGIVDVLNMGVRYSLISDLMVVSIETVAKMLCKVNGLDFDAEVLASAERLEEKDNMM